MALEPSIFSEFVFTTFYCLFSPLQFIYAQYLSIVLSIDPAIAASIVLFFWCAFFQNATFGSLCDPFLSLGSWIVIGKKGKWTFKRAVVLSVAQLAGAAFAGHLLFRYGSEFLPLITPTTFMGTALRSPGQLLAFPQVQHDADLTTAIGNEALMYGILMAFMLFAGWYGGLLGKALPVVVLPLCYYGVLSGSPRQMRIGLETSRGPSLNPSIIITYTVFGSEKHQDVHHHMTHLFGDLFGATIAIAALYILLPKEEPATVTVKTAEQKKKKKKKD